LEWEEIAKVKDDEDCGDRWWGGVMALPCPRTDEPKEWSKEDDDFLRAIDGTAPCGLIFLTHFKGQPLLA